MSLLRTLWGFVKRAGSALRSLFSAAFDFIRQLILTFFEGPLGAFERVVKKARDALSHALEVLRQGWLRIWQRAPTTPRDKRPTPGRQGLPLLAGTATTTIWYLIPLDDALTLNAPRFLAAFAATWVVTLLAFRSAMRRQPTGRIGTTLVSAQHRVGLLWFERFVLLMLCAGLFLISDEPRAAPALLALAIGFLTLLACDYPDRGLTDALPEAVTPLKPSQPGVPRETTELVDDEDIELRTFRWSVPLATRSEALDVTVAIDTERFQTMASLNPKRPTGGSYPDWTPWVISGSTDEVVRAAQEIRKVTDTRGFSRFEEAAAVLGFAQSVPYSLDIESTGDEEYWRYPIETMYEQTGDCEDLSILAASVLRELGHEVLPMVTHDHAAIGISAPVGLPGTYVDYEGHRYYYCETTASGSRIGQLPADVNPAELKFCPLRGN